MRRFSNTSIPRPDACALCDRPRASRAPSPSYGGIHPISGQHTDEILGEFGFDAGEISELRANRIIN